MIDYYINNLPFCYYKVKVTDASKGLTDKLERKATITTDWPDQHGVRRDYSETFFKERKFTLGIACFSRDLYNEFFAALTAPEPVRLTRKSGNLVRSYDVYLTSPKRAGTWLGVPYYDTLEFSEDMPVKLVYQCRGLTASLHIESEHSLQISWGDKEFDNDVFNGDFTHEYTDTFKPHYVIVSGRVSEATISTGMELVEKVLC